MPHGRRAIAAESEDNGNEERRVDAAAAEHGGRGERLAEVNVGNLRLESTWPFPLLKRPKSIKSGGRACLTDKTFRRDVVTKQSLPAALEAASAASPTKHAPFLCYSPSRAKRGQVDLFPRYIVHCIPEH